MRRLPAGDRWTAAAAGSTGADATRRKAWSSGRLWAGGSAILGGLAEGGEHLVGGDGQARHPDAQGVGHSVGDGRGSRDRGGFAHADDAALRHIEQDEFNIWSVGRAGQLVGFEVGIQDHAAAGIHDPLLVQRVPDAHDDAAVELAFARELVHHRPAVLHAQDFADLHESGVGIDRHLGKLHAAGAAGRQAVAPFAGDDERIGADFAAGFEPARPTRILDAAELLQLRQRLFAGVVDGRGDRRGGRTATAEPGRRQAGVADAHGDLCRLEVRAFPRRRPPPRCGSRCRDPACRTAPRPCRRDSPAPRPGCPRRRSSSRRPRSLRPS